MTHETMSAERNRGRLVGYIVRYLTTLLQIQKLFASNCMSAGFQVWYI